MMKFIRLWWADLTQIWYWPWTWLGRVVKWAQFAGTWPGIIVISWGQVTPKGQHSANQVKTYSTVSDEKPSSFWCLPFSLLDPTSARSVRPFTGVSGSRMMLPGPCLYQPWVHFLKWHQPQPSQCPPWYPSPCPSHASPFPCSADLSHLYINWQLFLPSLRDISHFHVLLSLWLLDVNNFHFPSVSLTKLQCVLLTGGYHFYY